MEGLLTPEDVRLLSEWAVDVSDGAGAELRLIVDDSALTASPEPTKRPRKKKYRSTYLRTREAKEGLQDEIEALESRLEVLKRRAGLEGDRSSFEQTTVLNAVMRGVVQQQHMVMASTHTSLVKRLSEQATHPLYTPVHLGKDWESRRQTMIAIKSAKLRTVSQYLMERTKDLDELLPHSSQDVTHDAEGNIICSQFDMVQFAGVKSLREVFDAILYFSHHEEIVLSEHLGVLAIRDNFDVADMIAVNSRMYWIDNNGVTTEWNSVNFAQLFDENYAVLACDNVDVDARYPYHPSSRVRRDFSGGIMLSVAKQSEDDSLVVVIRRASIVKIHRPKFPLSAAAVASLVKNVNAWGEAQIASIRSQIDSASPESPSSSPVM